ncbi:Uncharacterised protein [Algoriella xinjiangensis]|nr:hypothetical protein [Algoriella xinjiangensis]VDH16243.1 Uncharacterised protein [Algoriella xinjiangensis]
MKKILLLATLAFSTLSFGQQLGEFTSLELKNTNDIISYIDFKGMNNQTEDFVGRLDYIDGTGFSFKRWNVDGNLMSIQDNGRVGIGTSNPDEKLTVKGKIHAEEIIVDLAVPADYVFQKYFTGKSDLKADYEFPKLEEIEKFVKENNHLPGVPSAKEIQENGLKVGEMNNLLLQKIEEITLLLIEQQKEIKELKETINKK